MFEGDPNRCGHGFRRVCPGCDPEQWSRASPDRRVPLVTFVAEMERSEHRCAECGHAGADHSDAGSEPSDPLMAVDAWVLPGQMCCYARPAEDREGIPNWYGRVCGCSAVEVPGAALFYPEPGPHI